MAADGGRRVTSRRPHGVLNNSCRRARIIGDTRLLAVQRFRAAEAFSRARATPGVAAPRLSSGIYAPDVGNDTPFIATRKSIESVRSCRARERRDEKSEKDRNRAMGGGGGGRARANKRGTSSLSCSSLVGILSLHPSIGTPDDDDDDDNDDARRPPVSPRHSPIMSRACHPRRWSCQPYRNRFPPVVYLPGSCIRVITRNTGFSEAISPFALLI
jgi:hypothetical protein